LRPAFTETSRQECPRCHGLGNIRSVESTAIHIYRRLVEDALSGKFQALTFQTPVEVAFFLLNSKRAQITALEQENQIEITIQGVAEMQTPDFKRIRQERNNRDHKSGRPQAEEIKEETIADPLLIDPDEDGDDDAEEEENTTPTSSGSLEESNGETPAPRRRRRRRRRRRPAAANGGESTPTSVDSPSSEGETVSSSGGEESEDDAPNGGDEAPPEEGEAGDRPVRPRRPRRRRRRPARPAGQESTGEGGGEEHPPAPPPAGEE
ncbi:MAG: hypothetical protein HQL55_18200, partial [Magnetococcales bacterium]|nr:hypothetical protein [Magnetococcales bacterium]